MQLSFPRCRKCLIETTSEQDVNPLYISVFVLYFPRSQGIQTPNAKDSFILYLLLVLTLKFSTKFFLYILIDTKKGLTNVKPPLPYLMKMEGGGSILKETHSKFLTRSKLHKVVWVGLDKISLILKYIYQPFYVVKMILRWYKTKINAKIILEIQTYT